MKKNFTLIKIICILELITVLWFMGPVTSMARVGPEGPTDTSGIGEGDKGYTLLVPLGGEEKITSDTGFIGYLKKIINLAIAATATLSVLMLIIGGVQYVFAGVSEKMKGNAKDTATNAILGLLIALSGYMILRTINPELLNIGLPEIRTIRSLDPTE